MSGLFDAPAPRVFTIASDQPFLDVLIEALMAACEASDPFALADCVILAPNRRAVRAFNERFAARHDGSALLPAVRPLGDVADDPAIWGAEPIAYNIPPAIDDTRRRFELATLVRARLKAESGIDDPLRALAFADDLARLLDAADAAGGVDWSRLPDLVEARELAGHWRVSAKFLAIVAQHWPAHLHEQGLLDPGARRNRVLGALSQHWRSNLPQTPVIIAGSTGSVAATRGLMQTVAGLPRGAVVLPGLDRDLDDAAWDKITAHHPQAAMRDTLAALGLSRADVASLGPATSSARTWFLREVLAPADVTADWRARLDRAGGKEAARQGAAGLCVVEARTQEEEALAIALALRATLEQDGARAAFVTPDAGLARSVESKLSRWGVAPLRTLGDRFVDLSPGVLIGILCELILDDAAPPALAALITHRAMRAGPHAGAVDAGAAALLHTHLRGPRTYGDLQGLRTQAKGVAGALVEALAEALAPIGALKQTQSLTLRDAAEAIAQTIENLAGEDLAWAEQEGRAAADFLKSLIDHGDAIDALTPEHAARLITALVAARETPPPAGGDGRIAILGPLEARLARANFVILGGLNEGVWPAPPVEDGLLPRALREKLGLPSPDQRLGLAAHDFAQLASAPRVLMTRAMRVGGAPSVASRWIWRLTALAKAAEASLDLDDALNPVVWARTLDRPDCVAPAPAPAPRPKQPHRLTRISFTSVRTLQLDPYALYAKQILDLPEPKAIGAPPGPAERGKALHTALQAFADGEHPAVLLELCVSQLRAFGFDSARLRMEGARLKQTVVDYIAWSKALRAKGVTMRREVNAQHALEGGFELFGRADALHEYANGEVAIIDFKTGEAPKSSEVSRGDQSQLVLEALAVLGGGFQGLEAATPHALTYVRIGGPKMDVTTLDLKEPIADFALKAGERLVALLARYADETQPFLCKPRPQFLKRYGDSYDLLARRAEWANADEEDEA
jgi:ATP-dependent helicase/nuclease subunit B